MSNTISARRGLLHPAWAPPGAPDYLSLMKLPSPAFGPGEPIPSRFTCDGADVSPALDIADIPEGTACLALVMDDPDAPMGTWDHWVAYDIPLATSVPEGAKALGYPVRDF